MVLGVTVRVKSNLLHAAPRNRSPSFPQTNNCRLFNQLQVVHHTHAVHSMRMDDPPF